MEERIKLLETKLDRHIEEGEHRWEVFVKSQEANNEALNEVLTNLVDSTKGLVEVWEAGSGVIQVGSMVGRFAKWLTTLAVIGVAFSWVFDKFSG